MNFSSKSNFWKSNLVQRVITGVLGSLLLLWLITWNQWSFLIVCVGTSLIVVSEFIRLMNVRIHKIELAFLLATFGLIWFQVVEYIEIGKLDKTLLAFIFLFVPLTGAVMLLDKNDYKPLEKLSFFVFSFWYLLLPFVILFGFGFSWQPYAAYDYRIPLGVMFLHWLSDTAAYFAGRAWGRHLLLSRVSPNKTWEGFFTGLVANIILGSILEYYWQVDCIDWIIAAIIVAVFGLIGDLVESMFKRSLSVKDSSSLLPGHGGFLDRFDGFFFSLPALYAYYLLVDVFLK